MTWYVATNAMLTQIADPTQSQERFPIQLQVYLVEASTELEALEIAQSLGKEDEVAGSTGVELDGVGARLVFLGVKSLTLIYPPAESRLPLEKAIPENGAEIFHLTVTVNSFEKAKEFVNTDGLFVDFN
jgi:hypothetical protein